MEVPLTVRAPTLPSSTHPTAPALLLGDSHLPPRRGWVPLCPGAWLPGSPTAFLGIGAAPAASQTSHPLWAVREPRPVVCRTRAWCSPHPQRGGQSAREVLVGT